MPLSSHWAVVRIGIALAAFVAMFKLKWNMIPTLGVAAVAGIVYALVARPWLFGV